jgi:hypothetical protein
VPDRPVRWIVDPASGQKQAVFKPTALRVPDARARLWQTIGATPALRCMLTSNRPATVRRLIPAAWRAHGFPAHIWPIISIESSAAARQRLPQIAQWRDLAELLGVSCEPVVDAGVSRPSWTTPCSLGSSSAGPPAPTRTTTLRRRRRHPGDRPVPHPWRRGPRQASGRRGLLRGGRRLLTPHDPTHGGDPRDWPDALRVRDWPDGEQVVVSPDGAATRTTWGGEARTALPS